MKARYTHKKPRTSSSSDCSDSPRPLRRLHPVQPAKASLSQALQRSSGLVSPTKPAFKVLAEPSTRVSAQMRAQLPPRPHKRKRTSRELLSSDEDEAGDETEDDLASSTASSIGNRRTRSSARLDDCVRGVHQIHFDDDVDETENEAGDPDDEYYLHHAIPSQLSRLRKVKLVQLWDLLLEDYPESQHAIDNAGVDPEDLSKQSLVSAILKARDGPSCLKKPTRRIPTRSTSLPSVALEDHPPEKPQHNRSASLTEQKTQRASRLLRTRSSDQIVHLSDQRTSVGFDPELEAIEEDRSMREPTPIARRTRASTSKTDYDSAEELSDRVLEARTLRSGKVLDTSFLTNEDPAPFSESEEGSGQEDGTEDESDFEFASATDKVLLRLRRDNLVLMCETHDLDTQGTKKELVARLLDWRDGKGAEEGDDSAEDESFHPDSSQDISFISQTNEAAEESTQDSSEDEANLMPPPKMKGRKTETKTQALAEVDQSTHDRDGTLALLQDSRRAKSRPRPPEPDLAESDVDSEEESAIGLDLESLNLQDKAISPSALVRGEKIGSGGFKDVYRGRYRKVRVAIADIRGHLTENEIKELGLLRDLRHENIVKLIGVVVYESPAPIPCSLVTELCLNGDLFDYIRRDAPPPSFVKILQIMLNIASGLEYLHKRTPKIIHRDMKSSNVLITAKGVAKLTDFGLARVKNSTRSIIRSLVGTVNWQAPELWSPQPRYNEKVDCYATGMVFWEMLQWHLPVKKYPFEGMNEHAIYQAVGQKQQRPPTAAIARHWGTDIVELMSRMWAQLAIERPSMSQVVEELNELLADSKAHNR